MTSDTRFSTLATSDYNGATGIVYAKWSENSARITYTAVGIDLLPTAGGYVSRGAETVKAATDTTATGSAAYERTGYTFLYWADAAGTPVSYNQAFVPEKDSYNAAQGVYAVWDNPTVYYAVFTAQSFTVRFDVNGGTGGLDDMQFVYDVPRTLPKAREQGGITRAGYTFGGWTTAADGSGTLYGDGETVKNLTGTAGGLVTLYAYWRLAAFTLTISGNGGTVAGTTYDDYKVNDTTLAYEVNAGATTRLPSGSAFTRMGYVLDGWAELAEGPVKHQPTR